MKPQPHLLDIINPHSDFRDKGYKKAVDFVLAHQKDARRFIFDPQASLYLGHFIRDCGDLILLNRQFAIPPFDTTYVELNIQKVHEGIGKTTSNDIFGAATADTQVGFLLRSDHVYTMAASDTSNGASVGLFSYRTHGHWRCGPIFGEPYVPADPNDHWLRAALLLGTTVDDLPDEETRGWIIHTTAIVYNPDYVGKTPHVNVYSCMGEMRTLWAALLLINQPRHVETVKVPWQAGILRGKRHVYAAHNLVRINLSGQPNVRKVFLPSMVHTPRRRHEVKGHFMHWGLVKHCIHQWPMMPEIGPNERARWQCVKCGGWRTWRKDHVRCDARVGFVTKDYHVTDGGERP